MGMHGRFSVIIAICVSFLQLSTARSENELAAFKLALGVKLEGIDATDKLDTRYRESLEALKKSYQEEGKLKALLAVDAELKDFSPEEARELSEFPELKRLQRIYREQAPKAYEKDRSAAVEILKEFATRAGALVKELTKQQKIDDARAAQEELEFIRAQVEELEAAAGSKTRPRIFTSGGLYTDRHDSVAGSRKAARGVIYKMNVEKVTDRAHVIAAVTPIVPTKGDRKSRGEFRLMFGKQSYMIGTWNETDTAGGKLEFDVSKWVKSPGEYRVGIYYKGGYYGLLTSAVSIDTRSR